MLTNQDIKVLIRLVREEIKRTQHNKFKNKGTELHEYFTQKETNLYNLHDKLRSLIK